MQRESIVKHILRHLILMNRNTFLFWELWPLSQKCEMCFVIVASNTIRLNYCFYSRGHFIAKISISWETHSNGFLPSRGINDDFFFHLWTITPSSTDANEIIQPSLERPNYADGVDASLRVDGRDWGRLSRTCCFSLIWRGEQETVRRRGEGGPSALHGPVSPPATGLPHAQACLRDWH